MTPKEIAAYLRLTTRSLEGRRRSGKSPPWVSLSRQCVRYRSSDVLAWVEQNLQNTTNDERSVEVSV